MQNLQTMQTGHVINIFGGQQKVGTCFVHLALCLIKFPASQTDMRSLLEKSYSEFRGMKGH